MPVLGCVAQADGLPGAQLLVLNLTSQCLHRAVYGSVDNGFEISASVRDHRRAVLQFHDQMAVLVVAAFGAVDIL